MLPPHRIPRTWILVFCILCVLFLPVTAGAESVVSPTGNAEYVSIQDAIDWSAAGEIVKVESGLYLENIRISKRITLVGVDTGGGAPIISPGDKDPAIVILADGCRIEGFTIQNGEASTGIRITSNNNTIQKNTLSGNGQGIILASSRYNQIRANDITGNTRVGISLESASDNLIEENRLEKNTQGIALDDYSLSNTIIRNSFLNTQNVISKSATSDWSSPQPFTYSYLGKNVGSRMGNYWSDYRGKDANGDGIGDSPYVISIGANKKAVLESDQNIVDAFPLMDPVEYYTKVTPATGPVVSPTPGGSPAFPIPTFSAPPIAPARTTVVPTQTIPPAPFTFRLPALSSLALGGILILAIVVIAIGTWLIRRKREVPEPPVGEGSAGQKPESHVVTKAASVLKNAVEKTRSLMTIPSLKTVLTDDEGTGPKPSVTDQKNYFPRELENKYTEITFVGRGGIAWVFSAIRKTDGIKVAVKIPISFDEVTGKCFLNEIAAWETLRHENIVEVTAVNILPVPYVEMEFVPGSLEALEKPLPVWKAVHLITGVVDGLRYAHEHGFIHRDIKPHNILLNEEMVPKITDWGMSKVLAADVKKSSVAGFSLSYAAPEQVSPSEFGRTDERTDIYQLGVVFYELVTGSIPFGGESIVEVGNAILRESATPPSEYNPDAQAVEKIILKCLEKNPADRYQSAAELLDALQGYLDEDDE
jgi:parallel beta-helix repeat protein